MLYITEKVGNFDEKFLHRTYVWIDSRQKVGGHVFRKYVCEQFLVVGFQVLHFLLLLSRLQLP